jgi:hypothetical protein
VVLIGHNVEVSDESTPWNVRMTNALPPNPTGSSHSPPRWAWWVIGIAVPVLGIVVSIVINVNSAPPPADAVDRGIETTVDESTTEPAQESSTGDGTPGPSSEGSTSESEQPRYELAESNVPLTIQAPNQYQSKTYRCNRAGVWIDLDNLIVHTSHYSGIYYNLEYVNCGEDLDSPAIRLYEGDRFGVSDAEGPDVDQCLQAARSGNLPNPITVKQIQEDSVLVKGMNLCFETAVGNVILLHITDVEPVETKGGTLRTYNTVATQWLVKDGIYD